MRCCICASDCKAFTTNLRKHEEPEHEKEMDLDSSAGDPGDGAICLPRRRTSAAPVELAAAAALRLAPDHLLASAGTSGAVPHPLRRMGQPLLSSLHYAATHERAPGRVLGEDDARRARKVPPKLALSLRRLCSVSQRTQGGRWPGR